MKFLFTSNPSTALLAAASAARSTCWATASRRPTTQRTKAGPELEQVRPTTPSEIATYYVFMNVNEKPFTDVKVRQAVNYAINTARIQKLLAGQAKALNQIYPDWHAGLPGRPRPSTPTTPAKAKQLLADAGFPDGFKVTFVGHNVEPMPKLAQAVQNDLQAVGIDASIKLMDKATYWDLHQPAGVARGHRAHRLVSWTSRTRATSSARSTRTRAREAPTPTSTLTRRSRHSTRHRTPNSIPANASRCSCRCRTSSWVTPRPSILYQPMWNGMYGKNVGGYYYHQVWNLQFQEMWKLDGK